MSDWVWRNAVGLHGWPVGGRGPVADLDYAQRYIRGESSLAGGGVADVLFGPRRRVPPWTYWYDVNTAFHMGLRPGYDGPTVPLGGPYPPRILREGINGFLPLMDPAVYAQMLSRKISGPWVRDQRWGGVPFETAFDSLRPIGVKRQ